LPGRGVRGGAIGGGGEGSWWLRALAALVARLPWRALRVPGALLGWLAGSVLRIRRRHVEHAMRAAGLAAPPREARAMYAALGRSAFEFLWLSRRGAEALEHVVVEPASEAVWQAILAEGQGIVLAASHTGNWDLAAVAAARDVELLVVTKHLSAPSLDRFWQGTRARLGVRLSGARGAMAVARSVLGRGGAVAMMTDQVPGSPRHAVGIEFLGRRCLADRAPAALAASTGAPLVVVAARADGRGEHVVHVLAVIRPPPRPHRVDAGIDRGVDRGIDRGGRVAPGVARDPPVDGSRRAWIAEATAASGRALDAFVRAHPSQWLWMHRRWKGAGVDPRGPAATLGRRWHLSRFPPRSKTPSSLPDAASKAG
jgi:KDO2-lipid IV(A) lauroyltransferase